MALIPRVVTEASASGAQVIDNSLGFNSVRDTDTNLVSFEHLKKTITTAGNRRTWTFSCWAKRSITGTVHRIISSGVNSDNYFLFEFSDDDYIKVLSKSGGSNVIRAYTSGVAAVYRDLNGWYSLVLSVDTTQSTAANRIKVYVNGESVPLTLDTTPAQNLETEWLDTANTHKIGQNGWDTGGSYNGYLSQAYMIDGQALDASYFGFTDPLTGTWRPKKFSGTYTGEYPVADYTGGLPILATNSLGTAVTSGTRADSNSANIVLAVPFNGNVTDYSATIKGSGSALVGSTDSITYPTTNDKYYGSSVYQNADGDVAWYITGESAFTIGTGAFTVECWVRNDGNHDGAGGANEDQYVWHFTDINMRLRMWKPSGGSRIITFYTADITNEPTVATVADNEWHHIAVVREGTGSNQFKIYVNGVLSYTGTDSTNLSDDKFMVGNYSTTADYGFSGNIQDIRVYNAAKYTSAFTVPPDRNLAAGTNSFYFPFDGYAPIGRDQSGKGNDWTLPRGGSTTVLSKATGALPILTTQGGGHSATTTVRGKVGIAVTVYNSGSGNKYYLDGVEAPSLSHYRGQSVWFDTSDSTCAGHPLKFSTTSNGTHGGGTRYTDGVLAGISTGQGNATTFGCSFNGSNQNLGNNQGNTDDTDISAGDCTIEFWFRSPDIQTAHNPGSYGSMVNICNDNSHITWGFGVTNNDHYIEFKYWTGSATQAITGSTEVMNNQWYHVAFVRYNTKMYLYLNGVLQQEITYGSVSGTNAYLMIGVDVRESTDKYFNGEISNLRMVKGTAVYTSDFTPPSSPLTAITNTTVLLCQSPNPVTGTAPGSGTMSNTGGVTSHANKIFQGGTEITYPSDVADTLYYYCAAHSGMGGSISLSTDIQKADPYASKNVLAYPFVSTGPNLLTDGNSSGIDINGVGVACTAAPKIPGAYSNIYYASSGDSESRGGQTIGIGNFYGQSFCFQGKYVGGDGNWTGGYFSLPENNDLAFGTGDFTVEAWIYNRGPGPAGAETGNIVDARTDTKGWGLQLTSSENIIFYSKVSSSSVVGDLGPIPRYNWTHVAITRKSGTVYGFLDGSLLNSASHTSDYADLTPCVIGARYSKDQQYFHGCISDLRIYKGAAAYISDFTPASTKPTIKPDSPSGVAYGSQLLEPTNTKTNINGGSVAFLGGNNGPDISWTGTVAATHTLDFYVYASGPQTAGAGPVFLSDGTDGYQFDFDTNYNTKNGGVGPKNLIRAEKAGGGSDTGYQSLNGGWNHLRVVAEGTTATLFINGRLAGSFAPAGGVIGPATFYIGTKARLASTCWFSGFICNVRIIEAALPGTDSPVIGANGVIASSEGGTSAIFLWPGVNSVTENTGSDGDTLTATSSPVLSTFNPFTNNTVLGRVNRYATLDPLSNFMGSSSSFKLFDGNLTFVGTGNNDDCAGTLTTPTTGKYFYEATIEWKEAYRHAAGWATRAGINTSAGVSAFAYYNVVGSRGNASDNDFDIVNQGTVVTSVSGGDAGGWYAGGTVMGYGLDLDNQEAQIFRDGILVATTSLTTTFGDTWAPCVGDSSSGDSQISVNFGQENFKFEPPEGFLPLCTANLPSPGVTRPDKYFTPTLYTGSGSGAQYVSAGFKPDMVWIKSRSNAWYWNCYDSVRGSGKDGTDDAAYYIGCNDTSAQTNVNAVSGTQFQGFYGGDTYGGYIPHYYTGGSGQELNTSGATYVGYCWKAGGGTGAGGEFWKDDKQYASAAAVGLSGGDYTPKACSINTKTGFAILTWDGDLTGAGTKSIPHGLSGFADAGWMIISKRYSGGTSDWWVQHSAIADGSNVLKINSSNAVTNISGDGAITSPTNTLFYGNWNSGMAGSTNNVGYLWKDVPGVQKFGKYAGSGNNSGTHVYLGFRPAIVWVKSYDTSGQEWVVWDDERSPYNVVSKYVYLEQNIIENGDGANRKVDFLSDGFKFRDGASGATDYSGRNYIYCAWADQPTHNLFGGQSNAR